MPEAKNGEVRKQDNLSVSTACPFYALEMSKPVYPAERLILRHLSLALTFKPARTDKLCEINLKERIPILLAVCEQFKDLTGSEILTSDISNGQIIDEATFRIVMFSLRVFGRRLPGPNIPLATVAGALSLNVYPFGRRRTKRHKIVVAFIRSLGVSEDAAQCDPEGIEHRVVEETLAAFTRHLATVKIRR